MAGDADTYLVDTSAGEVTLQYGWSKWVTASRKGVRKHTAIVNRRRDLERLLVDIGLPSAEAGVQAKHLWKNRPESGWRNGPADPSQPPWKQYPNLTLVLFLVGLAIVVIAHVVFHFDRVAV
jgi:hypothetical protein